MIKSLPHPKKIILCDVYQKTEYLETLKEEIRNNYGYKGDVDILESGVTAPEYFYNSNIIVGATNVTDVLDINMVLPGTIMVDDTSPHCFDVNDAIERFYSKEDILFSEGGVLEIPFPLKQTFYLPPDISSSGESSELLEEDYNPYNIMGCIFSSLLTSVYHDIELNIGEVNIFQSYNNYQKYKGLRFKGSMPHCGDYKLDVDIIQKFRDKYGNK
jgi:hypothetical protein